MPSWKAHLHSVDESYFQHMRHALSFTAVMFVGAVCCLVHAFLPFLFEKKGSAIVQRLYDRMVVNRHKLTPHPQKPDADASGLSLNDQAI